MVFLLAECEICELKSPEVSSFSSATGDCSNSLLFRFYFFGDWGVTANFVLRDAGEVVRFFLLVV